MFTIIPNICMSVIFTDKKLYKTMKSFVNEVVAKSSKNCNEGDELLVVFPSLILE